VFRVLGGFVSSGKALELKLAGNETRYDFNVAPHCHARCVRCGKVADVEVEGLPQEGLRAKACGDFSIQGYVVEFFGTCKECGEHIPV
jgi:Fur family ferric uptake transcriptional regulator